MYNEENTNDTNFDDQPALSTNAFVDPKRFLSEFTNMQASNIVNAGLGRYNAEIQENLMKTQSTLRTYFSVNTKSIVTKLKKILFPFTDKEWSRSVPDDVPRIQAANPNLPELYIPMLFTFLFILLMSLSNIVNGTFSFTNVTYAFTKFFAIVVLMVLLTKMLFYVGCQISASIFTLFADLCTVSVYISLANLFCFNTKIRYVVLCYTFVAAFIWTIKTMKSQSGVQSKSKAGHTYSILLIAVLQGLIPIFFVNSCGCAKKIQIDTEITQ